MEMPTVKHECVDEDNNVVYHVMAYRKLDDQEVIAAVRYYRSRQRRKRPEKNKIITIITTIGSGPNN